jgi:hypothetical protein
MENRVKVIDLWRKLGVALGISEAQINKAVDHNEKYRVGATRTTEEIPAPPRRELTLNDILPEQRNILIDAALRVHKDARAAAQALGVDVSVVDARRVSKNLTVAKAIEQALRASERPLLRHEVIAAVQARFAAAAGHEQQLMQACGR